MFTCLKAWGGAFDVGSITQYVGAATAMVANVFSLTGLLGTLETNTGYLDKTFEFLDIPNAMYQGSLTTEKRSDRRYEVEFKDVSFKYPGSDIWALRHVNMKFKVGKRLAVVGENGSGKTTFIKLLCRLYDPQEGQILLNGIDIRKYRYDDYINIFSVVFQDFQLISQPLGNNVAGSMNYDRERVRKALLDAGFGDRLATMKRDLIQHSIREYMKMELTFRAVKHRKSPLPVRFIRMHRLLSSTSRPQHLTRLRKRRSIQSSMRSQVIKRLSISLTVCPLANSAMKSLYSTRVL